MTRSETIAILIMIDEVECDLRRLESKLFRARARLQNATGIKAGYQEEILEAPRTEEGKG